MKRRWLFTLAAAVLATSLTPVQADAIHLRSGSGRPPGSVLLLGRGWGHGRGMGQWGARGMALSGARYTRILAHYYRGSKLSSVPAAERIRVLLDSERSVVLRGTTPYTIAWGSYRVTAPPRRYTAFVRAGDRTVIKQGSSSAGPWRYVRTARGTVTISRAKLAVIAHDGSQRLYRGRMLLRPRGAQLAIINDVALQDYLRGVLPREMPSAWPIEALKSQAVAARTYAHRVRMRSRSINAAHDICDDARCQVYGGAARRASGKHAWISLETPRANAALRATSGKILTYRGRPILAEYSSSTGGYTTQGGRTYLRAVADPGDRASPFHVWAEEVRASSIVERWPALGRFEGLRVARRDGNGTWGGRVERLVLVGSRRSITVTGQRFQAAMGLRSRWFRVASAPLRVVFRRDLRFGTHSLEVTALQQRLRSERVYPSDAPITSYFGEITRVSVRRLQSARGLPVTGVLDRGTRAMLNRTTRISYRFAVNLGYGSRSAAVKMLQRRLRDEGLYPSSAPITGYFGPITRASVKRYQRLHGIPSTGFVGPLTRASLNSR